MERQPVMSAVAPVRRRSSRPAGFTLVELLVVIMIIAMLAALVTPAVMRARTTARNAAIKAEIDMLHMAIMNYKNDYGSFPPAVDPNPSAAGSPSVKHLQRLFPRCTNVAGANGQLKNAEAITPASALASWLFGYTGDPSSPIQPTSSRKKLFDFDQSRLSGASYAPAGKPSSPYLYISSAEYETLPIPDQQAKLHPAPTSPIPLFVHVMPDRVLTNQSQRSVPSWVTSLPESDRSLWYFTLSSDSQERPFQRPFNPDTFQILCAGQDEEFGTDDDLSNFWKGTRKEYLDSLKQ